MLDIKKNYLNKNAPYFIVNRVADKLSYSSKRYDVYTMKHEDVAAFFFNKRVISKILKHSYKEFANHFPGLCISKTVDWWDKPIKIDILCCKNSKNKFVGITIKLPVEPENWSRLWSLNTFSERLESYISVYQEYYVKFLYDIAFYDKNIGIHIYIEDETEPMGVALEKGLSMLKENIGITSNELDFQTDENTLVTYFNFPKEIKVACCQYLVYFTQFLLDIGLEVETEIKEKANTTLFKITPLNKKDALNFISEALHIYLDSPNVENIKGILHSPTNELAIQQWSQSIEHFKSQIDIVSSLQQMKDATITSLQISNYQYQQLLISKDKKNTNEEEEKIGNGIITIKKYDGKGFSINFAELLRRLKRVFKKK